jgi:hypothetical protein
MALLWVVTDKIIPGSGGMLLFQFACILIAAFLLSLVAIQKGKKLYFLPLLAILLPAICNIVFVIWKDVSFAASAFLGFSLWYFWRSQGTFNKKKLAVVLVILFYAAAVRFNALPAVFPLLLFIFWERTRPVKAIALTIVWSAVFFLGNNFLTYKILHSTKQYGFQQVIAHDLMGIYKITGKNYLPDVYLKKSTLDNLMTLFDHRFSDATTYTSSYFMTSDGSAISALKAGWFKAIHENLWAYLRHRWLLFCSFLTNKDGWIYHIQTLSSPVPADLKGQIDPLLDETWLGKIHERYVNWFFYYYRFALEGLIYLLASFLIFILGIRRNSSPLLALSTSSLCYLLPYFFVAPEVSYRYIYWSVFAVLLAFFVMWVDYSAVKQPGDSIAND